MTPPDDRASAGTQSVEHNIYAEHIRLVYDSTPSAAAAIVVAVGFLTYLFIDTLPKPSFVSWAAYMLFVAGGRLIGYLAFLRRDKRQYNPLWARLAILAAALTGVGWGVCSLLFFNVLSFQEQEVLILVVVAYTAGSLTTMFPVPIALLALLLPSTLPLVFLVFSLSGKLPFAIGSMLVFFLFFVSAAAGRLRRLLSQSLQLRFENEDLVGYLQTEKRKGEQLNCSLLQEVEARKQATERLVEAHQEAEKANMAKTLFLANMSHDIRTPMNGIIGMTRLALETELSYEQRKYLENIKISSDGLLGLLNDILDLSKIEAGQLLIDKHDYNLQDLLANIQTIMSYNAREKGLRLVFPENLASLPTFVKGDDLRLRQILINLIGNAIKFTQTGQVSLSIQEQHGKDEHIVLHFQVQDTGIGIPDAKKGEIFASFSQADSSMTREFGGSGLGLAISKQLVEMMGGKIWFESEENKGSIFHFTTLLEPGSGIDMQVTADVEKPQQHLHILVADDNEINRDLARLLLEKDGHSVVTVGDGLHALRAMGKEAFDLILMDVQMPIMDGLTAASIVRRIEQRKEVAEPSLPPDILQQLRNRYSLHHVPIIAITANAMEGDRQKCLLYGMDGYLTKPFDPLHLQELVAEFSDRFPTAARRLLGTDDGYHDIT